MVEDLKDALMSKEMQDAVNTIEFVLGKLYSIHYNTLCLISFLLVVVQLQLLTVIDSDRYYNYLHISRLFLLVLFSRKTEESWPGSQGLRELQVHLVCSGQESSSAGGGF